MASRRRALTLNEEKNNIDSDMIKTLRSILLVSAWFPLLIFASNAIVWHCHVYEYWPPVVANKPLINDILGNGIRSIFND